VGFGRIVTLSVVSAAVFCFQVTLEQSVRRTLMNAQRHHVIMAIVLILSVISTVPVRQVRTWFETEFFDVLSLVCAVLVSAVFCTINRMEAQLKSSAVT
jgi:magnesium-transporting ATPase (P-type)